jgi:nucleotide-binding universal stress UspA family protein
MFAILTSSIFTAMLTIRRILLPTDFSSAAADAKRRARALARLFDADLHILHVTRGKELSELSRRIKKEDGQTAARLHEHVSDWLGLARELSAGRPGSPPMPEIGSGQGPSALRENRPSQKGASRRTGQLVRAIRQAASPQEGILAYAEEIAADLIVIGTHGNGTARGPLLGSVADRVLRRAARPVVTVRPDLETNAPSRAEIDAEDQQRLIVVPIDFSEPTRSLIAHAKHWAVTFNAQVDFVHVVEEPLRPSFYPIDHFWSQTPAVATEARSRLGAKVEETEGPEVDEAIRVLVGGTAAEQIVDYAAAREARLILTATHGLSGLRRYVLGGVTDQVIRQAPCPVCALKSHGRSLIPGANAAPVEERSSTDSPSSVPAET